MLFPLYWRTKVYNSKHSNNLIMIQIKCLKAKNEIKTEFEMCVNVSAL